MTPSVYDPELLNKAFIPWDTVVDPEYDASPKQDKLRTFENWSSYARDYTQKKIADAPEDTKPELMEESKKFEDYLSKKSDFLKTKHDIGYRVQKAAEKSNGDLLDVVRYPEELIAEGFDPEQVYKLRKAVTDELAPVLLRSGAFGGYVGPAVAAARGMAPDVYDNLYKKAEEELWNKPGAFEGAFNSLKDFMTRAIPSFIGQAVVKGTGGIIQGASDALRDVSAFAVKENNAPRSLDPRGDDFDAPATFTENPALASTFNKGKEAGQAVSAAGNQIYGGSESLFTTDPRYGKWQNITTQAATQMPGQLALAAIPVAGPSLSMASNTGMMYADNVDQYEKDIKQTLFDEGKESGSIPEATPFKVWEKNLSQKDLDEVRAKAAAVALPIAIGQGFIEKQALGGLLSDASLKFLPAPAKAALMRLRYTSPRTAFAARIVANAGIKAPLEGAEESAQEIAKNIGSAVFTGDFTIDNILKNTGESFVGGLAGGGTATALTLNQVVKTEKSIDWAQAILNGRNDAIQNDLESIDGNNKPDPSTVAGAQQVSQESPETPQVSEEEKAKARKRLGGLNKDELRHQQDIRIIEAPDADKDSLEFREAQRRAQNRQDAANWTIRQVGGTPEDSVSADRYEKTAVADREFQTALTKHIQDNVPNYTPPLQEFQRQAQETRTRFEQLRRDARANGFTQVAEAADAAEKLELERLAANALNTTETAEKLTQDFIGSVETDGPGRAKFARQQLARMYPNSQFSAWWDDDATVVEVLNARENKEIDDKTNLDEWLSSPAGIKATTPDSEAGSKAATPPAQKGLMSEDDLLQAFYMAEDNVSNSDDASKKEVTRLWERISKLRSVFDNEGSSEERKAEAAERLPELENALLNIATVSSQRPNPNDQNQTPNPASIPSQEVSSTSATDQGTGTRTEEPFTIVRDIDGEEVIQTERDYINESRNIVKNFINGKMTSEQVLGNVESVRREIEAAPDLTPEQKTKWFSSFQNIPSVVEQFGKQDTTPTTSTAPVASIVPESTGSPELIAGEGIISEQPTTVRMNSVPGDILRTETGEVVFRSATDNTETVLRVKEGSIEKDPAALTFQDFESGDGASLVSEANKQFSVLPNNERLVRPFFRSQPQQQTEGGETQNEIQQTEPVRQEQQSEPIRQEQQGGSSQEQSSGLQGQSQEVEPIVSITPQGGQMAPENAGSTPAPANPIAAAATSMPKEEFIQWAKSEGYAIGDSASTASVVWESFQTAPAVTPAPVAETPAAAEPAAEIAPAIDTAAITTDVQANPAAHKRSQGRSKQVSREAAVAILTQLPENLTRKDAISIGSTAGMSRPGERVLKLAALRNDPAAVASIMNGDMDAELGLFDRNSAEGSPEWTALSDSFDKHDELVDGLITNAPEVSRAKAQSVAKQLLKVGAVTEKQAESAIRIAKDKGYDTEDAVQESLEELRSYLEMERERQLKALTPAASTATSTPPAPTALAPDSGMVSNDTDAEPADPTPAAETTGQGTVDRFVFNLMAAFNEALPKMNKSSLKVMSFRAQMQTEEGRAEIQRKLAGMAQTSIFAGIRSKGILDPVVEQEMAEKALYGSVSSAKTGGLTKNVQQDLLNNLAKTGDPFLTTNKDGDTVSYNAWFARGSNLVDRYIKAQNKRDKGTKNSEGEQDATDVENVASQDPEENALDPKESFKIEQLAQMRADAIREVYDRIAQRLARETGYPLEDARLALLHHLGKIRGVEIDPVPLGWKIEGDTSRVKPNILKVVRAKAPDIFGALEKGMKEALSSVLRAAKEQELLSAPVIDLTNLTLESLIEASVYDEIVNGQSHKNAIAEAREKNSTSPLMPLLAKIDRKDVVAAVYSVLNNGKPFANSRDITALTQSDMQKVLDSGLLPARIQETLQALVDLSGDGMALLQNSKNEGWRRWAELLGEQMGNRAPVQVVFNLALDPAVTGQGLWQENTNTVHVSPFLTREKGLMESTLLHEMMHPVWDWKVTAFQRGDLSQLNKKEVAALTELQDLLGLVKAEADKKLAGITDKAALEIAKRDLLGSTDLREFLNEAINHKPFQDFLAELKDPDAKAKGSLFRRIVNAILKLIRGGDVAEDSILQRSFELSLDLANYTDRELPIAERNKTQVEYFKKLEAQRGRSLTPDEAANAAADFAFKYPQPRIANTRAEASRLAPQVLTAPELEGFYNSENLILGSSPVLAGSQENIPGSRSGVLSNLANASYQEKLDFHTQVNQALTNPNTGRDSVAEILGIRDPVISATGPSIYSPSPGTVEINPADILTGFASVDDAVRYMILRGAFTDQNAIAGIDPQITGDKEASLFDLGRVPTEAEIRAVFAAFQNPNDTAIFLNKTGLSVVRLGFEDSHTPQAWTQTNNQIQAALGATANPFQTNTAYHENEYDNTTNPAADPYGLKFQTAAAGLRLGGTSPTGSLDIYSGSAVRLRGSIAEVYSRFAGQGFGSATGASSKLLADLFPSVRLSPPVSESAIQQSPELAVVEALTGQPITQNELNTITGAGSETGTGVGSYTGQSQTDSEDLRRGARSGVPDVSGGLGGGRISKTSIQSRLRNEPALQVSSIQGSRVEGKLEGAPFYRISSPDIYSQILSDFVDKHPLGGQVKKKTPEQLAGAELYLSEDGGAGFALYPTGELGSLFKDPSAGGAVTMKLLRALRKQSFDFPVYAASFNTDLVPLYSRMAGMLPVARLPWETVGRTDGVDWNSNSEEFKNFENGKPSVVIWAFDPENAVGLKAADILTQFPQVASSYAEAVALAKERSVVAPEVKESRKVGPEQYVSSFTDEVITFPSAEEYFNNAEDVRAYINKKFTPQFKALKSWVNDSVLAREAAYVVVGQQGRHYVEFNPITMTQNTRAEVDAIMQEEMIHAASGLVLMRKGIEWEDFYDDLGGSLSPQQRERLKGVYRSARSNASVGAEYFRAGIQQLLYGRITEAERKTSPMKKILSLLMDFVNYFRKGEVDPVVREVYEDSVRMIQNVDKKNARQDVLLSNPVPEKVVEDDAQLDEEPVETSIFREEPTEDPTAIPVRIAQDGQGNDLMSKGKPRYAAIGYNLLASPVLWKYEGPAAENTSKPDYDSLHYTVTKPTREAIDALIDSGAVDGAANKLVPLIQEMLKNPDIAAGMGWYSRMRTRLRGALGGETELFTHLLGATSAQTPVEKNFEYSVDILQRVRKGEFDRNVRLFKEYIDLRDSGKLGETLHKRKILTKDKQEDLTEAALREAWLEHYDILPKQKSGSFYNANSYAVLKAITGVWMLGKISPKTPQFGMNLNGLSLEATIDIWAARTLRRLLFGLDGQTQWRIQPKNEVGVSDGDFALGQVVMRRAAAKLGMNPDDLQAILWFGEKEVWDQNGWTGEIGGFKSSFDEAFDVFFPAGQSPRSSEMGSNIMAFLRAERKMQSDKDTLQDYVKSMKNSQNSLEDKKLFQQIKNTRVNHYKEYEESIKGRGVPAYIKQTGRRKISGTVPGYKPRQSKPERVGQDGRSDLPEDRGETSTGTSGSLQGPVRQSAPVPFQGNVTPGFNPTVYTAADRRQTTAFTRVLNDPEYQGIRNALGGKQYISYTVDETLSKSEEFLNLPVHNGDLKTAFAAAGNATGVTAEQVVMVKALAIQRAQKAANSARLSSGDTALPASTRNSMDTLARHYQDLADEFADDLMSQASLAGQELRAFRMLADSLSPYSWVRKYKQPIVHTQKLKMDNDPVFKEMLERIKAARRDAANSTTTRMQKALAIAAKRFVKDTSVEEVGAYEKFARLLASNLSVREEVMQAATEMAVVSGMEAVRKAVAPDEKVDPAFLKQWENKLRSIASEQLNGIIESRLQGGMVDAEASPELTEEQKKSAREQKIMDAWRDFSDFPLAEMVFNLARSTIVASDSPYSALVRKVQFDPAKIKRLQQAVKMSINTAEEIRKSVADRNMSVESLVLRLQETNPSLSETEVGALAEAVKAVYDDEVQRASAAALQTIVNTSKRDPRKLTDAATISKILPLVNMGAFKEEEVYNTLAENFGLPTWSQENADKIEAMANQVQALPEGSLERGEKGQQMMLEILRANIKDSRGAKRFQHINQIASAIWTAGILSGPPTQIVNAAGTATSVFLETFMDATGHFIEAKKRGVSTSQASEYYKDIARAWLFAFGKDANNTSLRSMNEVYTALTRGASKFKSEKQEDLSTLELFKFDPKVAIPGNALMEAITTGEWKKALPQAGELGLGIARTVSERVANRDAKGALKDYLATLKLVGRGMLATDAVNSFAASAAKEMMIKRTLMQTEGLTDAEVNRQMKEIRKGGEEAVVDAAKAQADQEATEGSFGPTGTAEHNIGKARRVEQLIEQMTYGNSVIEQGRDFAANASFNSEAYGLIGATMMTVFGNINRHAGVIAKPINPFPKTVSNLLNTSLNYTLYGYARAMGWNLGSLAINEDSKYYRAAPDRGSAEFYSAHAKATAGTLALGVLAMMLAQALKDREEKKEPFFEAHGPGPKDPKLRAQWAQSGHKPFTVRIGSLELRYTDWPGLNIPLGMLGTVYDNLVFTNKEADALDQLFIGVASVLGTTLDRNMLGGATALFDLMSKNTYDGAKEMALGKLASSYTGGFLKPSFVRYLETVTTGGYQDARSMRGWFLSQIPVVGALANNPAINVLGEPIKISAWDATAGRLVSQSDTHPILSPLTQADLVIAKPEAYKIYDPSKTTMVRSMSAGEEYEYAATYGKIMKERLTPELVQSLAEQAKFAPQGAQDVLTNIAVGVRNQAQGELAAKRQIQKGKELKGP